MGSSRLARKHEPTGAVLSTKSSAAIRMLRSFLLLVPMKIMKMQERKKDLADEVLSGETTGLSSLTREDLLEMLS